MLPSDARAGVDISDYGRLPAQENGMGLGTILLVVLVLAVLGVLPTWPHSRSWGYGPSGGLGLVVVIVLVVVLMGGI